MPRSSSASRSSQTITSSVVTRSSIWSWLAVRDRWARCPAEAGVPANPSRSRRSMIWASTDARRYSSASSAPESGLPLRKARSTLSRRCSNSARRAIPTSPTSGLSLPMRRSMDTPASSAAARSATAGTECGRRLQSYQLWRATFPASSSGSRRAGRRRRTISSTVKPARRRAASRARVTRCSSSSGRSGVATHPE